MANGKKVALYGCLGCGGFILLLILILAGGVGYISYQGYQFGKGVGLAYEKLSVGYGETDQLFLFTAPEDGLMVSERVNVMLQMRSKLAELARERVESITQTGDEIGEQMEKPGFWSKIQGAKEIAVIVQKAAHLGADIGQEHIILLKNEKMSSSEYQWILKTYLGTLSQATTNDFPEGATQWEEYLVKFDDAKNCTGDINFDYGDKRIDSKEIDRDNLLKMLQGVPYQTNNLEIVKQTISQLMVDKDIGILDYFSIQLDQIFKKQPHQDHTQ